MNDTVRLSTRISEHNAGIQGARMFRALILFTIAVLTGLPAALSAAGAPAFSHRVHPCTGEESAPELRARANSGIQCWMGVQGLHFEHWLDTYCDAGRHLSVRMSVSEKTITVHETYTGGAVRCRCVFKIEGEVRRLRPGCYRLRVLFDNRHANTRSVIEEAEILAP